MEEEMTMEPVMVELPRHNSETSLVDSAGQGMDEESIVDSFVHQHFGHLMRKDKTTKTIHDHPKRCRHDFDFAGWGGVYHETITDPPELPKKHLLDQWRATSIAGNDLIASVLYTVGVATKAGGAMAPISLLLICLFLYPYRMIYSEVGTALPLNGGTYNCLINATTKFFATIAGTLSLLSYTATAVVSAASATAYVAGEFPEANLPVLWMTLGILALFAFVTFLGVRDSAAVAFAIFALHGLTLCALIIGSFVFLIQDKGAQFVANYRLPMEDPVANIYYGFCLGLLGITGFETSSNYIEEQKPGVFPKTMNNMWWLVLFFNPTIAFLSLAVLPVQNFVDSPNNILSIVGGVAVGRWFRYLIAVDAAIVLCGGVLTAFTGVVGLVERMAYDRCLPSFLTHKNPWTKSCQWVILVFFILTASLYLVVGGDLTDLGGVFAVAFVGVMIMFALGNLVLKYKRPRLPRPIRVHWALVVIGGAAMCAGWVGNLALNPAVIKLFAAYFLIPMGLITIFFNQVRVTKMLLFLFEMSPLKTKVAPFLAKRIKKAKEMTVVFFTNTDEIHILNKAVLYSHNNELSDRIKIIHFYENQEDIPKHLIENHFILDHLYPKIQIDLHLIQGKFCPEAIPVVSKQFNVPANFMFVRCPGPNFPYPIGAFSGVRMIMA